MQRNKKEWAIEKFKEGCTWEETGTAVGVNRTTLWRWSQTDPEFAKAIEEAKADPDLEVEAVTFRNACDPDPAHNTLRMFWLNSRRGYKQRSDITSGDNPLRYVDRASNPRDIKSPEHSTNGSRNGNGVAPLSSS